MAMGASMAGTVEFRYSNSEAIELFLVGSFNGWNPHVHPMHRDVQGHWVRSMPLPAGVYQFHYLARIPDSDGFVSGRHGAPYRWSCSDLEMVVVTPQGGSFQIGSETARAATHERSPIGAAEVPGLREEDVHQKLLPLSRLEAALIRGFRRLPDNESRSAFLDVIEESVYS